MSKFTIKEIEDAMQPELSLDQLKEDGFEKGDDGKQAKQVENRIVVREALCKLDKIEHHIATMTMEGYTQREICELLKVSHHTIRATLDKIRDIIK